MEAEAPAPGAGPAEGRPCGECRTSNLPDARFCKACGASIAPPPECPRCGAPVPRDANFCSECGAKLVGARPAESAPRDPEASEVEPIVRAPTTPEHSPPAGAHASNIGANVALFAAFLAILIVVIYAMNKDAEKEVSPFEGGPPPARGAAPSASPGARTEAAPAPAGAPAIEGTIRIGDAVSDAAKDGTIFIVLRNAGMPNKGPPIAVRKIDRPSFPASFSIGPSDVMMPGMPFLGPFDVYARLDRDGNAMTKDPGDLVNASAKTGVKPGDTNVEIVLDERL